MNISLTPELEQFVQGQIQSGMYHSASEVIREGLRLLKRFNSTSPDLGSWYDAQIGIGLQQAQNGEAVPGELSYERLKRKLDDIKPE